MIKRILLAIVAIFALGAAVATGVVSAAFALYAVLKPQFGDAGAAALVALAFAALIALVGLGAGMMARSRHKPDPEPSLMDRLGHLARERPLLAGGAALAAGLLALKNPQVIATVVSAFLAGRVSETNDHKRR